MQSAVQNCIMRWLTSLPSVQIYFITSYDTAHRNPKLKNALGLHLRLALKQSWSPPRFHVVSFEFQPANTVRHMWVLEKSHQKHASFLFKFNTVWIWRNFDQSSAVYISITNTAADTVFSPHPCHEHPCHCTVIHIRELTWVNPFFLTSRKAGLDLNHQFPNLIHKCSAI